MKRLACCLLFVCFGVFGCTSEDSEKQTESGTPSDACKPVDCDGMMVCLENDRLHCGSCDNVCGVGQICSERVCHDSHEKPDECDETNCNGVCVDIKTDENNCGECGHICGAGMVCNDKKCVCENAELVQCDGLEACISLKTDSENCGECGHVCGEGQFCNGGICSYKDPQPPVPDCIGKMCSDVCVDIKTDNKHCGDCDHACGEKQSCVEGVCKDNSIECTGKVCDGQCVDIKTNNSHCGDCNHACGEKQSCVEGVCKDNSIECTGKVCDGVCVDINTDNKHCGGCGFVCGAGLHCESMNCACDDKNLTKCAYNTCVDVKTDPNHCGKCDNPCSGTCTNGICSGGTPISEESAGEVTGPGKHVIEYARQFLVSNTHMCTYDLMSTGKMPTLVDLTNDAGNHGYDSECANFASSVLIDTGELTQQDFLDAPKEKYRETVPAFLDLCTRGAKGYHFIEPSQAQAGDIWISYGDDGVKFRHHVELIIKVEGEYFWQIGSNNYNLGEPIECLNNHSTDPKYAENSDAYQRVTEHKRPLNDQEKVRKVCSKR